MMLRRPSVPWVVLSETGSVRWGGDLRRRYLLERLARATSAHVASGWGIEPVRHAIAAVGGGRWPWQRRPVLATAEFLSEGAIAQVRRAALPLLLDVHDQPVAQAAALGVTLDDASLRANAARFERNVATFPLLAVPSASFAALAGLDASRTIVAPNGTDSALVTPRAFPIQPVIGMASGAAPGRGIELLIDTARALRADVPELRLRLWLAAGGDAGEAYLASIREEVRADPWIDLASVPYQDLPEALGTVTVTVIPHPANAYMDVAVPIKLLDSMAAGRPVVATPRAETRRILEATGAGSVAADDSAAALAAAILPYLDDADLAARIGAAGRAAAARDYDWNVIGARLADEVIRRAGPDGSRLA